MRKGNCHNAIGELKKNIDTKFLSRSHVMETSNTNLISVMGGKWTIYRTMGEETVEMALDIMASQNLIEKDKINKMKNIRSADIRLLGDYRSKVPRSIKQEAKFKYTSEEYKQNLFKKLKENYLYDDKYLNYLARTYGDRSFDL